MTNKLTFQELREANVKRLSSSKYVLCEKNWTHAHWMQATVGELGELANILKKVDRGDFTLASVIHEVANELADVQTYLDIMAYKLSVDLGDATVNKFNTVSARIGSKVYIGQNIEPKVCEVCKDKGEVFCHDIEDGWYEPCKSCNAGPKDTEVNVFVNQPKTESFVVRVDGLSGALYEYKADHAMSPGCRLVTLNLATPAAPPMPVGMDQVEPQTASAQPSASEPGSVMERGGYVDRCAIIQPGKATSASPTPIDEHTKECNKNAEANKDGECICDYAKRFDESHETGAPEDHAHKYPKALATLESLIQGFASEFKEHGCVEGSVLKGDYWVIMDDGAMIPVSNWVYCDVNHSGCIPVYYAER